MNFFNKWKSAYYNPSFDSFENSLSLQISKLKLAEASESENNKKRKTFLQSTPDLPNLQRSVDFGKQVKTKLINEVSSLKVSLNDDTTKLKKIIKPCLASQVKQV